MQQASAALADAGSVQGSASAVPEDKASKTIANGPAAAPVASDPTAKAGILRALKGDLARLAAGTAARRALRTVPTGALDVDAHLPGGGLRLAALHEVAGIGSSAFAAVCLGRIAGAKAGALVWCQHRRRLAEEGGLYPPGLSAFGIDSRRLLVVDGKDDAQVLWAVEEALRSSAVAGVVGEFERLDLFQSRRLQLAAETGGGAGILLRPATPTLVASAAVTRWRVQPSLIASPWPELGALAWRAELWRCKGAAPAEWEVLFDEPTLRLAMAPALAGGALAPRPAAAGA